MDNLKDEYFHLQTLVEQFDARALTIKGWSVTLSMAGIGAGVLEENRLVIAAAAAAALLFWIVEAIWKSFQHSFYKRILDIEKAVLENKEIAPFQISTSWRASFDTDIVSRFFRIALYPHVFLPHLLTLVCGALLAAFVKF